MKSYTLALMLTILLVSSGYDIYIQTRKLKRNSIKAENMRRNIPTTLYKFSTGIAKEIIGENKIDSCVPDSWKKSAQPEEEAFEMNIASEENTWSQLNKVLTSSLNIICSSKDLVSRIINIYSSENKKAIKRYIRLFIRARRKKFRTSWSMVKVIENSSDVLKKSAYEITQGKSIVWKTVRNQETAGAEWAGKKVEEVLELIKTSLTADFEKGINFMDQMRVKITAFFQSDLMKNTIAFIKCLKTLPEAVGTTKDTIQNFIDRVVEISNYPEGWVNTIAGLLCGWDSFRMAIDRFILAIKQLNYMYKWKLYGRFLGQIIVIIGK